MQKTALRLAVVGGRVGPLVVAALVAGCGRPLAGAPVPDGSTAEEKGSVQLDVRVPRPLFDVVHWTVTRGDTTVLGGEQRVPAADPAASFLVPGLAPESYRVTFSGHAAPNATWPEPITCTGGASFAVAAGATARVGVVLQCVEDSGYPVPIETGPELYHCAQLTSYQVSSVQPGVGGTVDVSAAAADRSPTAHPMTYRWTATAAAAPVGTFVDATAPATRFTCPPGFEGPQIITVAAGNDGSSGPEQCPLLRQSLPVLCIP